VVPFRAPNLTTSVDPMLSGYNLDNGPKQFNGWLVVVVIVFVFVVAVFALVVAVVLLLSLLSF